MDGHWKMGPEGRLPEAHRPHMDGHAPVQFGKIVMTRQLFLILALISLMASPIEAQPPAKLRLGHDLPPSHPWHQAALRFAEDIARRSDNGLQLSVFPSSQLGDLRELMELTQRGLVDLNVNTAGILAIFVPDANVFNLPFLFSSHAQADAFYQSNVARGIASRCPRAQIICLTFVTTVFRSPMNNKRPIRTPDDMRGLKIRLMQVPLHIDSYRALGAVPTALPFSELYTAAQTGVVDGFENAVGTLHTSKLYEVGKYLDTLPVFLYTNVLAMSDRSFRKLTDLQRKAVTDSVPAFATSVNAAMLELERTGLQAMAARGVITTTGPFDLAVFRQRVRPVYEKWVPMLSPEIQSAVKELQHGWSDSR
jgi:TRAP-type transport system periplasmic protein